MTFQRRKTDNKIFKVESLPSGVIQMVKNTDSNILPIQMYLPLVLLTVHNITCKYTFSRLQNVFVVMWWTWK